MHVKTTIILATDTVSALPIFGQTAINRLILLSCKLGISKIYVISNEKGIAAVNSNMTSLATPLIVENASGLKKVLPFFDIEKHHQNISQTKIIFSSHFLCQNPKLFDTYIRTDRMISGSIIYSPE